MCPKNVVNSPDADRSVLRSVRRALGPAAPPTPEEELNNLTGLSGPQQKAVRAMVAKIQTLNESGMHSSARRLESQALQTVRRYRRIAKNVPNRLTGV